MSAKADFNDSGVPDIAVVLLCTTVLSLSAAIYSVLKRRNFKDFQVADVKISESAEDSYVKSDNTIKV